MSRPKVIEPIPPEELDEEVEPNDEAEMGDLAALSVADEGWSWQVHRIKSAEEVARNPRGKPWIWICSLQGQVDLQEFHGTRGGGLYEFWGSRDGKLRKRIKVELDGTPKIRTDPPPSPPPPPPPTAPVANPTADPGLILILHRINDKLERLERETKPSNEKPSSITELVNALGSLDGLRQKGQVQPANPDREAVSLMIELYTKGLETGQAREPLPAGEQGTDWLKIAETFVPLANRVLDRMEQRRQTVRVSPQPSQTGGPVAPSPSPPSHAEVVGEQREEPTEAQIGVARMMVVVDILANSFRNAEEVEDVADTVERVLPPGDLAGILAVPTEAVVQDIATRAGGRYPDLASTQGRSYLASVISELKRPVPPED